MRDITILKASDESPFVEFNPNSGELKIQGKSLLEDTFKFYSPIMEMLVDHLNTTNIPLKVSVMFDYLNSSTSRYFMEILLLLEKSSLENSVSWYHEADDDIILEKGKQFKSICSVDFHVKCMNVLRA